MAGLVPESARLAVFFLVWLALFVLTSVLLRLRHVVPKVVRQSTWPLMGVAYIAIGLKHFHWVDPTFAMALAAIIPPNGTWGFWYVPGDVAFHIFWTGVAEVMGGAGVLLGAATDGLYVTESGGLVLWSSRALLVLTLAVTPANVYMLTHGALLPGFTDDFSEDNPVPLSMHVARLAAQSVLLSILWILGSRAAPKAASRSVPNGKIE